MQDGTAKVAVVLSLATAGAVAAGAAGVVGREATGALPCPFRALTGLPCPFCGITHALLALGEGDISGSLAIAPAAPVLLAVAVAVILAVGLRGSRRGMRWPAWLTWTVAGVVTLGWIAKAASLGTA